MENTEFVKRPGVGKTALVYGLLIGVLLILIQLVFYLSGGLTNIFATYVSYAVMLAGIILVIKARRDQYLGGIITYGQALGVGTLTIFFASLALGVYIFIFYKYIDPGAIDLVLEAAEEKMLDRSPNISDEELDMALSISRYLIKPGFMAFSTIFNYTFLGFVMSLITSIFLKKNKPEII